MSLVKFYELCESLTLKIKIVLLFYELLRISKGKETFTLKGDQFSKFLPKKSPFETSVTIPESININSFMQVIPNFGSSCPFLTVCPLQACQFFFFFWNLWKKSWFMLQILMKIIENQNTMSNKFSFYLEDHNIIYIYFEA